MDFCIETIEAVRTSCPDPLILVEHRLDFSEYVPDGFGTGDLVIVADGVLEIADFKGGRGVREEADHNSQLMLYGLGAAAGVRGTVRHPNCAHEYRAAEAEQRLHLRNVCRRIGALGKDGGASQGAAGGEGRRRVLRGRVVPILQGAVHLPQAQ